MTTLEKLEELIYHGFKDTDRKFQETDRKFQDTDRKFQEAAEWSKETDRKFQETDRKFQNTDRKFQEAAAERSKETDRRFRETDKLLDKLTKNIAGITDSVGLFAENMVKPAVARLFAERGIELTDFFSRASHRKNGNAMEVDVLGSGTKHVVAVEVKFRLGQREVADFLEKLPRFFEFFERYRGLTLYGAVAGMSIDEGVDRFAYNNGLFILAQSGENIRMINDKKFRPREYVYEAKTRKAPKRG